MAGTDAVSTHVPPVRKLATLPETVQMAGVLEAKAMTPFDGDVALKVAVVPAVCVLSAVKVTDCGARVTVNDCVAVALW